MRKITCWYRVVNGKRKWNHFEYGCTNRTSPVPLNKKQEQMWKGVKWCKMYGLLIEGVVKEFSCDVCPYYPNCDNDTCEEAYMEYVKRQREKAIKSVKEGTRNDS